VAGQKQQQVVVNCQAVGHATGTFWGLQEHGTGTTHDNWLAAQALTLCLPAAAGHRRPLLLLYHQSSSVWCGLLWCQRRVSQSELVECVVSVRGVEGSCTGMPAEIGTACAPGRPQCLTPGGCYCCWWSGGGFPAQVPAWRPGGVGAGCVAGAGCHLVPWEQWHGHVWATSSAGALVCCVCLRGCHCPGVASHGVRVAYSCSVGALHQSRQAGRDLRHLTRACCSMQRLCACGATNMAGSERDCPGSCLSVQQPNGVVCWRKW
jgi:hypothetical protein